MYKVLVIEDEEIIRKGLILSIDFESVQCVIAGEASNGEEGVLKIREIKPDIVITDINMPLKNGIELLEETQNELYSAIIISGYDEFAYAKQAIRFGVRDYLLKPIDSDEMIEALKHAIQQIDMKRQYQHNLQEKQQMEHADVLDIKRSDLDGDQVVANMISYIQKNYAHKIVMQDLCEELKYSEASLNRRFKQFTTYTFNEYLNRYRIQKSLELIREHEYYLYDIAQLCGYSDYKYFSSVFKKYAGVSPNEFVAKIEGKQ